MGHTDHSCVADSDTGHGLDLRKGSGKRLRELRDRLVTCARAFQPSAQRCHDIKACQRSGQVHARWPAPSGKPRRCKQAFFGQEDVFRSRFWSVCMRWAASFLPEARQPAFVSPQKRRLRIVARHPGSRSSDRPSFLCEPSNWTPALLRLAGCGDAELKATNIRGLGIVRTPVAEQRSYFKFHYVVVVEGWKSW